MPNSSNFTFYNLEILLITYFKIKNNHIYFCYIYDKSDFREFVRKDVDMLIVKSLKK